MKRKQLQAKDDVEALVAEQAVLLVRELRKSARQAPSGKVLDHLEGVILDQGRELLGTALESSMQEEAEAVEKKGRPAESVAAAGGNVRKAIGSVRS